jgi:hypothetical protein
LVDKSSNLLNTFTFTKKHEFIGLKRERQLDAKTEIKRWTMDARVSCKTGVKAYDAYEHLKESK